MIDLLAQASESTGSIEVPLVASLIISIVTALGGAGAHKILARKTTIEGQPIAIKWEQKFATKEDLNKLESKQDKDIRAVYDRINDISPAVSRVEAKVDILLDVFTPQLKKPL